MSKSITKTNSEKPPATAIFGLFYNWASGLVPPICRNGAGAYPLVVKKSSVCKLNMHKIFECFNIDINCVKIEIYKEKLNKNILNQI